MSSHVIVWKFFPSGKTLARLETRYYVCPSKNDIGKNVKLPVTSIRDPNKTIRKNS
jgi:hypothetical protein